MPKIDVDGRFFLRGRAVGLLAVIGCASAFAACGGSSKKPETVVAKSTPEATVEAATEDAAVDQVPGDAAPEETPAEEAPADGEETEDETAAKEAVALYVVEAAGGDGESACARLTDDAIGLILADGVERTSDEAYAACVEGITAAAAALSAKKKAALENALLSDVTVVGDDAIVMTSLNAKEPINLVRGETGWLIDYIPQVGG